MLFVFYLSFLLKMKEFIFLVLRLKVLMMDLNLFIYFVLQKKSSAPPQGARIDMHRRMLALLSGSATVYDSGLKLQTLTAPRLIGVEPFLEALLFSSRRSQSKSEQLILHLEPGSQLLSWNIRDLAPMLSTSVNLRAALKSLYFSTVQDDERNAKALIASDPVVDDLTSSTTTESTNELSPSAPSVRSVVGL
mmetsp:Transcript_705/g.1011  ORF Transcript_705/g.1011 Transcript_705/m.1011 type:complete len:192 (+) Transcript_705:1246-1821(+)